MNKLEAIHATIDGKKVRDDNWYKDEYVYFDGRSLVDSAGVVLHIDEMDDGGRWEIYEPEGNK